MGENSASKERRLWIGNLDPRINEYHLLKLVQKHGEIEKFDLLFHRNGPLAGTPRGYAFVTYIKPFNAEQAKDLLHNKLVGSRRIIVTWAHSIPTDEPEKPRKQEVDIPALAISKTEPKTDREFQIQAIEAKLKIMERQNTGELEINKTLANERPIICQYQQNKQTTTNYTNNKYRNNTKRNDRSSKPYSKFNSRR